MATVYDLGHYLDPTHENVVTASAAWVIAVIRFKYISTFSREKMESLDLDGSIVNAESPTVVITSDCTQVMTTGTKSSHVKSMVATLRAGRPYGALIMPGDWVVCWMVKYKDQAIDLVKRIKNKEPCNNFMDGLKFIGRVQSCPKSFSLSGDGKKDVKYTLAANGFTEFDSSVFWDPYMAVAAPLTATWMGNMGLAMNKFLTADGIDVNGAIPELVELLFGRGISKKAQNPGEDKALQIVTGGTAGDGEADFAYIVPETIGSLLGQTSRSKKTGILAYADLLHALYGVQKYETFQADRYQTYASDHAKTNETQNLALGKLFQPSELKPMIGKFVPQVPALSGRSVWSVLSQYVNQAVNEMYTCLRANKEGKIVPTLVVRQLPFTSKLMEGDDKTGFLEVPRWKARDSMLLTYNVGRSDSLRFNFIHMEGQAAAQAQNRVQTFALVRSPPIRDDHDARRSGLRADMQVVACGIEDQQLGPKKWNEIRADIMMGQHLTLTGTFNMVGVQEPIAEGDNFEYDDVVFHIETVTHTCAMDESGKGQFMTTLQVSHGVQANPQPLLEVIQDDAIYALTPNRTEDLTSHDPGLTHESIGLTDFFVGDDEEQ